MSSAMQSIIDQLQISATMLPKKYETIHQLIQDVVLGLSPNEPNSSSETSLEPSGKHIKIRKFKYFSKLPLEIRRMVWAECARVSRVVQFDHYDPFSRYKPKVPGRFYSAEACQECMHVYVHAGGRVPIMLQVNQESRKEGLRYYEKPFGEILTRGNPYFNFAVDVLHLGSSITGGVLFGHRYENNAAMSSPCACAPVTPIFKKSLSSKLRHLSVIEWSELELKSTSPLKFSLGMFQQLKTFTLGWELVLEILSLIKLSDFKKIEDIFGDNLVTSSDRLVMHFLHHNAMTQFLTVPKIKAPKKSKTVSNKAIKAY